MMEESVHVPSVDASTESGGSPSSAVSPGVPGVGIPAEDSLEARYMKLKQVAVRLKRNVTEKSEEIDRLKSENSKIYGKNQNLSTIQLEFDKAMDEVERLKRLEASLQRDLKTAVENNVRLKESSFENTSLIQILTSTNKSLTDKLEKLEKSEQDMQKVKIRAEELENELKEHRLTHVDAKQEKRQTAMLALEITDYEKKLADANEKIEEQQREIGAQALLLEEKDRKIEALEKHVVEIEYAVQDLKKATEQLKTDLGRKSEKINFLQDELGKLTEKLTEKKSELAKLAREYENSKFSFSSESKVLVEKCNGLLQLVSQHEHKISVLEENRRSRESQISNLKLELEQVDSDYNNYKVKAQAMLKSQKPFTLHSQETDELENLQKIVQDFHSEIAVLKSDMQTLRLENENLTMERAELGSKLTHVKTVAVEKEVNLGNELQKLKQELRQKESNVKTMLETAKIDKEAVIASYKVQLDSVKTAYEKKVNGFEQEIMALKSTIEASDYLTPDTAGSRSNEGLGGGSGDRERDASPESLRIRRLMMDPGNLNRIHSPFQSPLDQPLAIDTTGMTYDQLRMIPRGECEGSENIFTPTNNLVQPSQHYNVSFEQLLGTSEDSKSGYENEGVLAVSVREELLRCQSQVKHLSNLLRESESNGERLTQLSEALKEEIRRVERDNERKEHLKENTEYLKNVILKFVTLQGEDERLRLIPVFKTMLRLAPSEVESLETSVKGITDHAHGHPSLKDGHNNGGSGWASYIPRWNSGGAGK